MSCEESIADTIRRDRDEGAARLVSDCRDRLYAFALRLCDDPHDAEALVFRTFEQALDSIDSYRERQAFHAWLAAILLNFRRKQLRGAMVRNTVSVGDGADVAQIASSTVEAPEGAGDPVRDAVDGAIVRDAIETLPAEAREVLLLHYFADMSVLQIARYLATPAGTVKSRLHYARKALAVKLGATTRSPGGRIFIAALILAALTAIGAALVSGATGGGRSVLADNGDGDEDATVSTSPGGPPSPATTIDSTILDASTSSFESPDLSGDDATTATTDPQVPYIMNTRYGFGLLLGAGLSLGTQASFIDNDTLVYVSSDTAPAPNAEMNDLRAAGDTSKPSLKLTYNTQPTLVEDSALPTLYAGHFYDAESTVNTNVLKVNGKMLLEMTDNSYLDDSFTAEFFFRTENNGTDGLIADSGSNSDAYLIQQHANWYFRIHNSSGRIGQVTFNDSKTDNYTTYSVANGQWHHFAVVWDKPTSTIRAYIDYNLHKETDLSDAPLPKTSNYANLNIGRGVWGDSHRLASGRYDGIRITQRALAPAEFLSPSVLPIDGDTLAYMHFDTSTVNPYRVFLGANALSATQRAKGSPSRGWQTGEVAAATIYPGARSTEGKADTGIVTNYFTGSNGDSGCGYSFADPNHRVGTTNFTAEVFAKFTRADDRFYGYIFNQVNVWRLFVSAQGNLGCSIHGTSPSYVGPDSILDNRWHHIAAVYDKGRQTFSVYLDYQLFHRFENVDDPMIAGATNPEMLLFGGGAVESTWDIVGSVPGALYDELRITGRALSVAEFLTDTSIAGADPVFQARFENSWAATAPTGRYAPVATASASGAAMAYMSRVSHEIRDVGGTTLFEDVAGLSLSGGTVSYAASGALDLRAGTAEFFIQRTAGGAGNVLVAFAPDCDASSALWSLAADGTVSIATDADADTLSINLSDGAWHHVAVSWSQGAATTAVTVWRDYAPAGTATLDGAFDFGPGAGFILGSAGASGAIDELRLREGILGADGMLYAAPPPATVLYVR